MIFRIPFLAVAALTLVALAGMPLLAEEEKIHEATVVKAGEGKITLTFKGDDSKHTHDVAKDAKITLDDKEVKLEALKEGFSVKATMDDKFVIHKIVATTKAK